MNPIRTAFLDAYEATRPLIAADGLAAGWNGPSALQELSMKGSAGHLVRAGAAVLDYLEAEPPEAEKPVDAAGYFVTVLGSMGTADHLDVRARGEAAAGASPQALLRWRDGIESRLREALDSEGDDRLLTVFGGLDMRLDDYLVTRIVEVLVHTDDLAVSLGGDPPEPPPDAVAIAIENLVEVARRRHGDRAVMVALARRERDPIDALRVFGPAFD